MYTPNGTAKRRTCECADHLCPAHPGQDCTAQTRTKILYRSDMDGVSVAFCAPCTEDALRSGVFAD